MERPTAENAWERKFGRKMGDDFWNNAYKLIKIMTNNCFERDFMTKYMHRQIYTNQKAKLFGLLADDTCDKCGKSSEDLYHMFYECEENNKLIENIIIWLNEACKLI